MPSKCRTVCLKILKHALVLIAERFGLHELKITIIPSEIESLKPSFFAPSRAEVIIPETVIEEVCRVAKEYCAEGGVHRFEDLLDHIAEMVSDAVARLFWTIFIVKYKGPEKYRKELELVSALRSFSLMDIRVGTVLERVVEQINSMTRQLYFHAKRILDDIVTTLGADPMTLFKLLDRRKMWELVEDAFCEGDLKSAEELGAEIGSYITRNLLHNIETIDRMLSELEDINMTFIVLVCRRLVTELTPLERAYRVYRPLIEKIRKIAEELLRRK